VIATDGFAHGKSGINAVKGTPTRKTIGGATLIEKPEAP